MLSSGMCTSPDFAAIAAQIFDKSVSTGRLVSGRRDRHDQPHSSSASLTKTNERTKLNDVSSPTISVAASKQNMASVAARIAAIEQNDKCADPPNRQVTFLCQLILCHYVKRLLTHISNTFWNSFVPLNIFKLC